TTDAMKIRAWWRRSPRAGVGVACGSGLLVLDVDPRNGGNESLAALVKAHGALPNTVTARTGGGGQHQFFRVPVAFKVAASKSDPRLKGLDLQGEGRYVVAPPSLHPSGEAYSWAPAFGIDEHDIAPAPQWLLDL